MSAKCEILNETEVSHYSIYLLFFLEFPVDIRPMVTLRIKLISFLFQSRTFHVMVAPILPSVCAAALSLLYTW